MSVDYYGIGLGLTLSLHKTPQVVFHVQIVLGVGRKRLATHDANEAVCLGGAVGLIVSLMLQTDVVVALEVLLELNLVLDGLLAVDAHSRRRRR